MLWTPKGALLCPTILLTSDFGDFGTSSQLDPVQPGTAWAEVGGGLGLQSPVASSARRFGTSLANLNQSTLNHAGVTLTSSKVSSSIWLRLDTFRQTFTLEPVAAWLLELLAGRLLMHKTSCPGLLNI